MLLDIIPTRRSSTSSVVSWLPCPRQELPTNAKPMVRHLYVLVFPLQNPRSRSQIHAPVHTFASILSPSAKVTHTVLPALSSALSKLVYVQLIQSSGFNTRSSMKDGKGPLLKVSGGGSETTLGEGDGVFITGAKAGDEVVSENAGGGRAEFVLFEMDG